jgi:hypothetical protein
MKKIILLFLLGITQVFVAQNLISDGTFNTQTGAISGATSAWQGYGSQVVASDNITSSKVGNVNNGEGAIRQDVTVVGSTTYQIKFDYRWVSGSGSYGMTIRFQQRAPSVTNLTISNVGGGTLNGTSDGFVPNTTPDVWYNASFRVTVPATSTLCRMLFFKGSGNRPFRMDNVSVRKLGIFDGSTDSDWATAANWDTNEIPDDDDVIIPTGQNVVISSTTGAVVGNIDVDSAGSLIINGGGSLVVNGTPTGNITYKRTLATTNWYLMSSPVVGESYDATWISAGNNNIATGTGSNLGIATYQNGAFDTDTDAGGSDTATGPWEYIQSAGGTFDSSKGYSIKRDATGDISFTGTYPTGALSFAALSGSVSNFNLVGNAYPTYLTLSDFFTNNPITTKLAESTVWLWDQSLNTGDGGYVSKTSAVDGTFQIAPGQAFFINAASATNIIFYQFNGGHTNTVDTFSKEAKTLVQLNISSDSKNAQTALYFLENTTTGFDNGYDASKFTGVNTDFDVFTGLISSANRKMARQVLPISEMENIITPIGLKAKSGKEITFSIEAQNLPSGVKVFLEDRLENKTIRLDEVNSNYKVTISEALNGVGRFYLHTKSSALSTDDISLANVSIYKTDNSTLRIVGLLKGKANVKMFNILGKQMMNTNFESTGATDISIPRLAKGVYIVQIQTKNGSLNKKIILE